MRVQSSSCCFPRASLSFVRPGASLSFDQWHVTRSPPIRKRIWVGRYNKTAMVHIFATQPKLRDESRRDRKWIYSGNPGCVQLRRNYVLVGETQLHILPLGRYYSLSRLSEVGDERTRAREKRGKTSSLWSSLIFFSLPTTESLKQAILGQMAKLWAIPHTK